MKNISKHLIFNNIDREKSDASQQQPLVSAIITTYKRSPDIVRRAVKSILRQSYSNIELFIVNDCPADKKLADALEAMVGSLQTTMEIHYIVVAENGGACKARNIGLSEVHGKYIACLDDDDEWMPQKIERYVVAAEKDSNIGIVYGGVIVRNEKSEKEWSNSSMIKPSGDIFYDELGYNIIGSCSFPLLRKTIVDKVGGFCENMPALQDWELYLRMLKLCHAQYIQESLNVYYIYEGERISANPVKRVNAYEKLHAEYKNELSLNRKAAASFYMMGCYFYGLNLNLKKGLSYWYRSVVRNPMNVKKNYVELFKLFGRFFVQSKNI